MRDFSKYLKDGRRVAAFGQQIGNEVEVFLLYCSKKDHFSKQLAKTVYAVYLSHNDPNLNLKYFKGVFKYSPVIFRIPIKEGDSAEYTFKMYMRDNFYRLKTINTRVIRVADYLVGNGEFIKHRVRYEAKKLSS